MQFSLYDKTNPYRVHTYFSHPRLASYCNNGKKIECEYHHGGAYEHQVIPQVLTKQLAEAARLEEIRRNASTPEPVSGRKHMTIQTDLYIEILRDIPEARDILCQTNDVLDIPAQLVKPPGKPGKDVSTKILDGELFDFQDEVRPVLEFLASRVIEQSLIEVMEEEELVSVWAQLSSFQALRNSELGEVQRLREHERRNREEKQRRYIQLREVLEKERELAEKIAARAFTREMLADLFPAVFSFLKSDGYFYDCLQREIENNFFPWVMTGVHNISESKTISRHLLNNLIYEVAQIRLLKSEQPPEELTVSPTDTDG